MNAMYHIIGADGGKYGPVTADQLRQWIREGRAGSQTQVQAVDTTDWRPLGTLPEFAPLFGQTSPAAPPAIASVAANRAHNKIAAGVCGILLGGLGIHKFILGYTGAGLIMLLVSILTCGVGAIVMYVIGLIEGIIYLTKTDEEFVRIYVDGRKEWF
jgi:TM2 domain-containing membrane protein YozV